MGLIVLLLLAAAFAFGFESWLKRWWLSGLAPLPIYFAYVWLELNVLPFNRGGFPGWEAIFPWECWSSYLVVRRVFGQRAGGAAHLEGMPMRSNSALVTDACAAALRAFFSAAQRGR
jgi:hypothetical protein